MNAKVVFVGEAFREHEALHGVPFVGPAGAEFMRMLAEVGFPCERLSYNRISPNTMALKWSHFPHPILNTFNERPEGNNVELFYDSRTSGNVDLTLPSRRFGSSAKYPLKSKVHHIHKLHLDLERLRPNLIVPLGATACWAIGLGASIGKLRGFIHSTKWGKALPVNHPAAILYKWDLRVPALLDLSKARREMESPEVKVTPREIWTEPTIDDLWRWWDLYGSKSECIGFDIETLKQKQVTEVGFAADPYHALHIPFCIELVKSKKYQQWWPDAATEAEAWKFVKHVCECPIPKMGQNVVQYDIFMMLRELNIVVAPLIDDTMTMAHAYQPEMGKSLYDLGAIWLDERSWKSIRKDTGKDND